MDSSSSSSSQQQQQQQSMMMMMMISCFLCVPLVLFTLLQLPNTVSSKLHILESAKAEGAVCLDGSAPAYEWEVAKDDANRRNWVVYLQGAGWCLNSTLYQAPDKTTLLRAVVVGLPAASVLPAT
ncbi:hypothetical protein DM860_000777 [Cuscuta australis]|uniref:Pectin acetylesterase n=1 Tax=Cuscuta australis TaxID=267555 RepID=A0A328D2I3_9ASTE|nr:hypothetical protein DM860_000777 [Cuscuta australis]